MGAEDAVREAYRQGLSDGHGLNKAVGVADEIAAARAVDTALAACIEALEETVSGCHERGWEARMLKALDLARKAVQP